MREYYMSVEHEIERAIRVIAANEVIKNVRNTSYSNAKKNSDVEIGNFKRSIWNSDQAADQYCNNVERYFFDAVTSKFYTEYIKPTDKVLDVGAGTGRLSFVIADKGCEVTSVDISASMLKVLEKKRGRRKINTILSDGEKIPLEDEQFDAVVSMDLLAHFPNWPDFLREKTRVCKNGGHIIYNFYCGENLRHIDNDRAKASNYITNGDYVSHCTKDELQYVCEDLGLEIVKLQPYDFFGMNGMWFPNLSAKECIEFRKLYIKFLANEKILTVIKDFEQTIVNNLSHEYCATMMVILKRQ
jgi:ubiquinone/menaquinone biosynthesis C-methylase UbiE